jgi:drug/metabolite transporter (DMT)-like permease
MTVTAMQNSTHLRAITLVLLAVFMFACQDAIGKYLFASYPVPFVQAVRYGVNLALMLLIFVPRIGTGFMRTTRWPMASLRGLALALGSLTGGLALRVMPLAETNSILYLAPLALLFLARPLLGEKVKWFGWVATAIGFAGLLFIARPGSNLSPVGLFYAFLCLITAVVYPLLSRLLSKTESTETLMFYVALTGSVYYFAQLPWTIPQTLPSLPHFGLMLALGVISLIGHGLFTAAYARAPVSLLAPFTYAHIAWATLLGWLVFQQVPDMVTFIGIGFVATGGVGNAIMNHLSSRAALVGAEPKEI